MLKTEPARQKGRKWAKVPLREWKMKCFPGLIGLSTPILLLSLFTGLSGKPIFSQNASIAQQRLFWLGTAFCMRNLPFFVRAGLNVWRKMNHGPFSAPSGLIAEKTQCILTTSGYRNICLPSTNSAPISETRGAPRVFGWTQGFFCRLEV
jgi:hypothetical protein